MGWTFPTIPIEFKASFSKMQSHLHSITLIIKNGTNDFCWDPLGSSYIVQASHQSLCSIECPMPIWSHWKIAWNSKAIPKIKFFIWTLLKWKILTSDNLQRHGIIGPSRCPNCQAAEETIHHLFIDCPFSTACWREISPNTQLPWNPHSSIGEVLHLWKKNYPWQKKNHNIAKRVWDALPYSLLWKIWLARNNMVFKNKATIIRELCNKARSLTLETILVKRQNDIDITDLCVEERNFIAYLLDNSNGWKNGNLYQQTA